MTTILEYASPAVIACDKREAFAQGSEATKQSIYPRAQKDGLLRFARNDAALRQIAGLQLRAVSVLDFAMQMHQQHSPEMAHFFAQNIIAPCELFSEN
jgi:hypothetical protein